MVLIPTYLTGVSFAIKSGPINQSMNIKDLWSVRRYKYYCSMLVLIWSSLKNLCRLFLNYFRCQCAGIQLLSSVRSLSWLQWNYARFSSGCDCSILSWEFFSFKLATSHFTVFSIKGLFIVNSAFLQLKFWKFEHGVSVMQSAAS